MVIPEPIMLLTLLLTTMTVTWYGVARRNWMMLAIDVALLWLILFYSLLIWDQLDENDYALRVALYRPGLLFLLLFFSIFLLNGHINRALNWFLTRAQPLGRQIRECLLSIFRT